MAIFNRKAKTTDKQEVTEAPAEQAPVEETTEEQPAEPAQPETAGAATTDKQEVTIYDPQSRPHRTYSLERHGENFRKLAEQYVSHRLGWTAR